jgi:hypothetical protein
MGLFRDKRNEAAALPLPVPASTVHNHAQSYAPVVAVGFACLVLAAPLLWIFLEFMLSYIDPKNAGRNTAFLVLGLPALYFASLALGALVDKFGTVLIELRRVSKDADVRIAQIQLQAAQTTAISPRATGIQNDMASLALAVLQEAYQHGAYTGQGGRPWARGAARVKAEKEQISGITFDKAGALKGWLLDGGYITDDEQVNYSKFKQFVDAQRDVEERYHLPIVINGRKTSLPYQERTSVINNVN